MLYAKTKECEKIEAYPNSQAICPICDSKVISKCGEIKVWHWAHKSLQECDLWGEGETIWHKQWKEVVPKKNREVVIDYHRADIKNNNGMITELQNSRISTIEITEREEFYKNMIWLFNGISFVDNLEVRNSYEKYDKEYYHFRWKWFNRSIMSCKKNVYFDFGLDRYKSYIFRVTKFTEKGVTGYFMERKNFIWFINNGGKNVN